MRLSHIFGVVIACLGLAATDARADKLTDAEELFRRAKALMAEKKDKEACPLFEESEKLDPQMGTLLNLAICHENIGRVASAWGEFRAVEQMANQAGREDRAKLAHERAVKLENRLPRLKIVLPPENRVEGLAVKVDGEPKGEPLWSGVAVDPGTRIVETTAPGKKPNRSEVKVDKEGQTVTFTIPKLEEAPPEPVTPAGGTDPAIEAARRHDALAKEVAANRSRRTKGVVVAGAGAAVLAAGGVFGVLAILKNNDVSCAKPCVAGSPQATTADQNTDRALLFANVANVAIPVGAIVTIVGAYLVLSSGPTTMPADSRPKTATLLSRGYVAPTLGGVALGSSW